MTLKHLGLSALWLLIGLLPQALRAENMDSILHVLDTCLLHKAQYEQWAARQAADLERTARATRRPADACAAWMQLGHFEFARHGEQALAAYRRALQWARRLGDVRAEAHALQNMALVYGMCGLPWEGRALLDSACADRRLRPVLRERVFTTYYDLYDYFYAYNLPGILADRNYAFLHDIEDSVRKYETDPTRLALTFHYSTYKAEDMVSRLKAQLRRAKGAERGMVATALSNKYGLMRDIARRDYYWALGAVENLRSARHDNEALNRIAARMAELGQWQRARRYALAAYDEAKHYQSRSRMLEAAPTLAAALQHESLRAEKSGRGALGLGVAALVLLAGALAWARRQRQRAHRQAEAAQALEQRLQAQQKALEAAREDTETKEEYMTRFLELGLDSILKFQQMRQMVLLKLQAGETERLKAMMKQPDLLDRFQQRSLQRFDIVFLRLYPDFVDEVNHLLKPGEGIALPDTEILNNELRLLAFLRLGITDSAKIAAILGVSVNTIYFYRSKLRGRALNRHGFEAAIMGSAGAAG